MPKINLSIPHQLSQDEAKERIARLIAENRAKAFDGISDLAENWSGYVDTFSFRYRGFAVTGKLEAQEAQIVVNVDLPFMALPFKGRIEQEMLTCARQLLA